MSDAARLAIRILWSAVCLAGISLGIWSAEETERWWLGILYCLGIIGWLAMLFEPPKWIRRGR